MKKILHFNKRSLGNSGFTIIELMIATAVFSVVLIIIVFSIISITRTYTRGITQTNTQNIARNIVNDVSQAIEFDGCGGTDGACSATEANPTPGTGYSFCVGSREYIYQIGWEVEPSFLATDQHSVNGLVVTDPNPAGSTCPGPSRTFKKTLVPNGTEFLNPNMRLSYFNISEVGSTDLYNVDVEVVYGGSSVLQNPTASNGTTACLGTVVQQDFCATAKLDTVVQERID
ncbi:MAG TPA: prepilin-type N-terminal cleavage/methylation domain-containing protein [Candidatus Saccharimonadales bacterium]|nr:prepilin-type N-terminal cleavage/methylation domain-containing protein [Candidatus Saccharimonadales bacterium]